MPVCCCRCLQITADRLYGLTVVNAGTGKVAGDRHPKIRDNVLIGASATILGNIVVNRGAQVLNLPLPTRVQKHYRHARHACRRQ